MQIQMYVLQSNAQLPPKLAQESGIMGINFLNFNISEIWSQHALIFLQRVKISIIQSWPLALHVQHYSITTFFMINKIVKRDILLYGLLFGNYVFSSKVINFNRDYIGRTGFEFMVVSPTSHRNPSAEGPQFNNLLW